MSGHGGTVPFELRELCGGVDDSDVLRLLLAFAETTRRLRRARANVMCWLGRVDTAVESGQPVWSWQNAGADFTDLTGLVACHSTVGAEAMRAAERYAVDWVDVMRVLNGGKAYPE